MNLFPYDSKRNVQKELIESITEAIGTKTHLVAHAPTGLGKTVAALAPALQKAIEENKTIFFLTSRHTQHKIAIDTLRLIKEKFKIPIPVVDIIGKKNMCLHDGVQLFTSGEFSNFCKKLVEESKCEFYENFKKSGKVSMVAENVIRQIEERSPMEVEEIVRLCHDEKICPYEISVQLAKHAKVIVADYYYIFNPSIQKRFFCSTICNC